MKKRNSLKVWMLPWVFVFFLGCATVDDVQILDRDIHQLQSQVNSLQKGAESLRNDLGAVQKGAQKDLPALKSELQTEAKKLGADLQNRLETLQNEVRILNTGIEEYKQLLTRPSKEIDRVKEDVAMRLRMVEERMKVRESKEKALEDRAKALEDGMKGIEGRVDGKIEGRMKGLEESLRALDGKIDRLAARQVELEKMIALKEKETVEAKIPSTGAGDFLYKDAYETFQRGNMEAARRKFEGYLKQYPNTELSDNAQFWIGETYYKQKDFEKAILEYEKAIAKYPEGDKISAALLKQGLAFQELGDKSNARNLLRRVIDRYPNSEQAEVAKKSLETLK
jgi:tol-pal system protein YbgF